MGILQTMFIGFDYGTANCSVAVMRENTPQLLTLENGSALLPSMLCAPTREAVSEWLYRHHDVPTHSDENQALLRRAIAANRDEDIEVLRNSVQFGLASLQQYVEDPEEVYFVKSPKSFLGASGLKPQQVALFEDLVCAMMLHIKLQAESQLPEQIDQAVIGRPINFQGLGGDEANAQAQGILERAAHRAGFRDVVFQFEPVAAGLDFEATLSEEKRVLVVDIGGGTTDIGVLTMNGIAQSASLKVAGAAFDEAIIRHLRRRYGLLIGTTVAEEIKMSIGCVTPRPEALTMTVKGRDLKNGLAREATLASEELMEVLRRPARQIMDKVLDVLESTTPELVADIARNGIVLTGGGSQLFGMDRLLCERTEMTCVVADDADSCAAYGCGKSLSWMNHMQEGTINLARRRLLKE